MYKLRGFMRKIWGSRQSYIKLLLVFTAFFLLVFSSLLIMSRTLNTKLLRNADETMNDMQALISQTLQKPEVPLNFIANTIEDIYRRGEGFEAIKAYIDECSSQAFKEKTRADYYGVYGYFDAFGEFYDGGGWQPVKGYLAHGRPWYVAAAAKGGQVAVSDPYINADTQTAVVGYSRLLYNSWGGIIGVVCIDVPMDYIKHMMFDHHITEGGYGFVTDENMIVIIHPNEDIVGEYFGESNPDVSRHVDKVIRGLDISSERITNNFGVKSILFGRRIDNGWYMSFIIPETEYYKELYEMMWIISALGVLMAAALSVLLVSIDRARNKSDFENRRKSSFLAVMSHEIRTPMNAILGITEMQMQQQDEKLSDSVKEAFDRIYYSGSLLLQIINDLLDLSKLEAGKLEILPEKYEIASLINEIVHLNKIKYDSKPIEFKLNIDENIPASLIGDELRIKQIINNLLSNAFKYTRSGEIEFSVTSENTGDEKTALILTVSDTGIGMTESQLSRLFDEYSRFNMQANRTTTGTGLGMSITRNLIKLMQGEISVESEPEKGSVFTVRLPQELNGSAPLGREVAENLHKFRFSSATQMKAVPILREHMPYGSVLIIDDVETNLFVAKMLMQPYGMNISTAESGYEAIELIKAGNVYDIIFMDHMMPKMDGIEATKIIRGLGYKHPIVALTANAVAGQADIFLTNGFDDFISKPIDIRVLNTSLNRYIRDKQTPETIANVRAEMNPRDVRGERELSDSDMREIIFSVPGLNAEQGISSFDGNLEDYISALRSFVKNTPRGMEKLRGVTEENLPDYAARVHGLKIICAWISADGLAEKAARLEELAKAGGFAEVAAMNEELLSDTETLIEKTQNALM